MLPDALWFILSDIYRDKTLQFVVGRELVTIRPTSGFCRGDGLSSIVFNLFAEPDASDA